MRRDGGHPPQQCFDQLTVRRSLVPVNATRRASSSHPEVESTSGLSARCEVLGGNVVEELPEPLDLVFLLVGNLDAGGVEHGVRAENRDAAAQRQSDRVQRAAADAHPAL